MRTKVLDYARTFRTQICEVEKLGDNELASQAELLASLLRAKTELGFAGSAHREMLGDAYRIISDSFAVRERVLDLHANLAALANRLGVDPMAIGDGGKQSDVVPLMPQGLHAVADERQAA